MNSTMEAAKVPLVGETNLEPALEVNVEKNSDLTRHPHDVYMSMISRWLEKYRCADWLDVGCGWHLDFPWEHDREKAMISRAKVVGIDPDWQAVSRHRTVNKRAVGFVEGLPFANHSFDIVTANVVVEHLERPLMAFSEIFRVLRIGGCFIFRTPSARSYFVRIARVLPQNLKVRLAAGIIEDRHPSDIYPAHYRANTTEAIEEICRTAGFRKLDITVTKAQGVLSKLPRLRKAERAVMAAMGFTEGNLIGQVSR